MKKTHGHSGTREYRAWRAIRHRCGVVGEGTPRYVALGMAPEWQHDFLAFLEHIGPRPGEGYTVDRIDTSRGYFPGNIHWATATEQTRNLSSNRLIIWNGESLTAGAWAERTGISRGAIYNRVFRRGWPAEKALTTPMQVQRRTKKTVNARPAATKLPEYLPWRAMRRRCRTDIAETDPRVYAQYAGRGITVCPAWDDFWTFLRDVGPRPGPGYSLDRIDNDGPYSPENCRWATRQEQGRNTSRTTYVTYEGERLPASVWDERMGLPPGTINARVKAGWSDAKAVCTPRRAWRRRHGLA